MIYCRLCFQQPVAETSLLLLPKLQCVPALCGSAEEIQIERKQAHPIISPLDLLCIHICPPRLTLSPPAGLLGNLRLAASTCPGRKWPFTLKSPNKASLSAARALETASPAFLRSVSPQEATLELLRPGVKPYPPAFKGHRSHLKNLTPVSNMWS
ncbi:hypothetical protein Q8A67_021223 [Cirrhinus molitorella]|uniref:Uncharacterized protein n=1 Tax=Cirrhinus molitorella TaxID=172907 RepID=A0AA88PAB5_9TELE|nr:hypothetical protein Q8A67_021223 [Cirrhinus molitorella]